MYVSAVPDVFSGDTPQPVSRSGLGLSSGSRMAPGFLPADVHGNVRALHAYWATKRQGRDMPARRDLDPLDIPALLRNLLLIDVRGEDTALSYRLVGTAVVHLFGRDLTGQAVDARPTQAEGRRLLALALACIATRRPCYDEGILSTPRNWFSPYQRLILPLSSDGRRVDMLLGLMLAFGPDGEVI